MNQIENGAIFPGISRNAPIFLNISRMYPDYACSIQKYEIIPHHEQSKTIKFEYLRAAEYCVVVLNDRLHFIPPKRKRKLMKRAKKSERSCAFDNIFHLHICYCEPRPQISPHLGFNCNWLALLLFHKFHSCEY